MLRAKLFRKWLDALFREWSVYLTLSFVYPPLLNERRIHALKKKENESFGMSGFRLLPVEMELSFFYYYFFFIFFLI